MKADWEQHIAATTVVVPALDIAEEMSDLLSRLFALSQERPLAALGALRELAEEIEPQRVVAVARARHRGESWQKVANALGVARQSAWEKYQFAGTTADVDAAYAKAAPPTS
ncbi:hypothetical protein ABCR94_13385 [Streptomyces sp. 21So2-11]|uniref:hypothetical protein n=1 Tax=Streptomyces sp. 21So2-11 TaxID=3144408 RepID=UPI00321ABFD2